MICFVNVNNNLLSESFSSEKTFMLFLNFNVKENEYIMRKIQKTNFSGIGFENF